MIYFDRFSNLNLAIKLTIEGHILLFFVNLSQIFSEGMLVIAINKVQFFLHLISPNGYMIYDETNASTHQSLKSVENNIFSNNYHVTELDIVLQKLCIGIGKSSHHKVLTYEC